MSCGTFFLGDTRDRWHFAQHVTRRGRKISFVLLTFAWESVQLFFKKRTEQILCSGGAQKITCNLYLFLFLALQSVWVDPILFSSELTHNRVALPPEEKPLFFG